MQTNHSSDTLTVKITANDRGNPAGKLADAELHFGGDSPLAGLKLIGFSIWERRGGSGRNVTFPARSYAIKTNSAQRRAPEKRSADRPDHDQQRSRRRPQRADSADDLRTRRQRDRSPRLRLSLVAHEPSRHQKRRCGPNKLGALAERAAGAAASSGRSG